MFRSSLLIVLLLLIGCSSSKKAVHEDFTEVHLNRSEYADNASVIDYIVDTTRLTDEVVEIERTEFYDIQYWDSVAETQKQLIRAKQKTTITKKESKKGVSVRHDSTLSSVQEKVVADSTTYNKNAEELTINKPFKWWWLLLVVVLLLLGIYARYKYIK